MQIIEGQMQHLFLGMATYNLILKGAPIFEYANRWHVLHPCENISLNVFQY